MAMRDVILKGTTNASGDLTVNAAVGISGFLVAVEWIVGTFDAGVDATISIQTTPSGNSKTVLTLTNANSSAWYNVRDVEHDLTGAARTATTLIPIFGIPRLVVAQGGNAKTGGCVLYYLPE